MHQNFSGNELSKIKFYYYIIHFIFLFTFNFIHFYLYLIIKETQRIESFEFQNIIFSSNALEGTFEVTFVCF